MDAKTDNDHGGNTSDNTYRSERKTLTDVENIAEKSFKRKKQLLPSPPTSKKVSHSTPDIVNGASQFEGVIDLNDSLLLFDGDNADSLEMCDANKNNTSSPTSFQTNLVHQSNRTVNSTVVQLNNRVDSSFKTDNLLGNNDLMNVKANQYNASTVDEFSSVNTNNNATDGNCLKYLTKTQKNISVIAKVSNNYKANTNTAAKEIEFSRDSSSYSERQKENISKWKKSSQNKRHYSSLVTRRFPGPAGILPRLVCCMAVIYCLAYIYD